MKNFTLLLLIFIINTGLPLTSYAAKDTLPPHPKFTMQCGGTIEDGFVEDWPQNPDRSNLSEIIFNLDSSFNYRFTYDNFIPGKDSSTRWMAWVLDLRKDARLVVTFSDIAGNDTTISVDYASNFLNIKPDVDFGHLKIGDTVIKETIAHNEHPHDIFCDSIILKNYNQGFDVNNIYSSFTLLSGSSIKIQVKFTATKLGDFSDSLGNSICYEKYFSARVHAIVDSVTLIKEELITFFDIFPNPADEILSINLQGIYQKPGYVRLFDSYGNVVFYDNNIFQDKININTKEIPSGMYFLQIRSGGGVINKKIMIIH